jgi:hypothetical protein
LGLKLVKNLFEIPIDSGNGATYLSFSLGGGELKEIFLS